MAGKFELYQDKADQFRFRLKSDSDENIGQSEGYTTKAAAINGIESVKKNAVTENQFVYKTGANDKTYFNLKAKNHQVILSSSGYGSESDAQAAVKSVMKDAPNATVIEV